LAVRVLICPDKFAGSLTAAQATEAIAAGWASINGSDVLDCRPLADGGPGFLEVIEAATGGKRIGVPTVDPLGRPVAGEILVTDVTAYIESAHATGLSLVAPDERDPLRATSYGLGALVMAAIDAGASEIIIGLGGSATNDGGAGFLEAIGAVPVDDGGMPLARGGAALSTCAAIAGTAKTQGVRLVGATDVDSPLTGIFGASAVYGPQKGASREDVLRLDAALDVFSRVLSDDLPSCPPNLASRPGAGAAGGLGAAILALGGELRSGIGVVRDVTRLDEALDQADVVITGEGSLDAQSLRGKVIAGVASGARDRGLPCFVLAGQSSTGRRESAAAGIADTYTLIDHFGSEDRAMQEAASGLSALAAKLANQWRS
jgi:glycerate kinase